MDNGYDGIVIEGFGAGNVPPTIADAVVEAMKMGIIIILVSRCFDGEAIQVYDYKGGGAQLGRAGVISGGYLSGQKARLKLMIHASIEIADTAESLRAGKRGKISIGYQSSARFVVPSILHSFCSAYPDITLDIEELGAEKLNESIVSGNIDIAFSFSVIRSGIHVYDHLKRLELFRDDLVAFAGYGHYDRHFRQGSALDLSACRDEILMQINHAVQVLDQRRIGADIIVMPMFPGRIDLRLIDAAGKMHQKALRKRNPAAALHGGQKSYDPRGTAVCVVRKRQ